MIMFIVGGIIDAPKEKGHKPLSDTEKEIRSRLSESILFSELNGN